MGGLGPGIGGAEYLVIAVVALLVVGPERLPALLNKLGKLVAKARNMANEFRSSFDEMARQSELDELRKEVDALRRGQALPLGAEAEATFRSISDDLNKPLLGAPTTTPALTAHDEWPDSPPVVEPLEPAPPPAKAPRAKAKAAQPKPKPSGAAGTKTEAAPARAAKAAAPAARPRTPRKKAVEL